MLFPTWQRFTVVLSATDEKGELVSLSVNPNLPLFWEGCMALCFGYTRIPQYQEGLDHLQEKALALAEQDHPTLTDFKFLDWRAIK